MISSSVIHIPTSMDLFIETETPVYTCYQCHSLCEMESQLCSSCVSGTPGMTFDYVLYQFLEDVCRRKGSLRRDMWFFERELHILEQFPPNHVSVSDIAYIRGKIVGCMTELSLLSKQELDIKNRIQNQLR